MKNILLMFMLAMLVGACCPCAENEPPKQEKKSVAREAVEGFTGKTAVDNLNRAKPKIGAANERGEQSKRDVDELTKP